MTNIYRQKYGVVFFLDASRFLRNCFGMPLQVFDMPVMPIADVKEPKEPESPKATFSNIDKLGAPVQPGTDM